MDDAVRELVECFYAAVDRRDWSTVEALVSPRVVVEVGSSEPFGWDEWRADLDEFTRGFPDGHHVIEEVLVDGSHGISRCRLTGTHTGDFRGVAPTGTKVSICGHSNRPLPGRHAGRSPGPAGHARAIGAAQRPIGTLRQSDACA